MKTLEENLSKKLKAIKKVPEVLEKIEENIKETRGDKSKAFFNYSKEERMKNIKTRKLVSGAVEKAVIKFTKNEVDELAKATGLSTKAVREIISTKTAFKQWKARQSRAIDVVGLSALGKLIRTVNEGRVSAYQGALMFQMLRGSIFREPKNTNPMTSINIGDNRKVSVYYPNFTPKDKKDEYNTVIKEKPED